MICLHCTCLFQASPSSLPLHCSPYPILASSAYAFVNITSSPSATTSWLNKTAHRLKLVLTKSPSDHLVLMLSALSLRVVYSAEYTTADALTPLLGVLTAMAKAQPSIVRKRDIVIILVNCDICMYVRILGCWNYIITSRYTCK